MMFSDWPRRVQTGQTNANPISMDAIQEIQVVVAPFDVRQSGFTGGGINAITKQGNNTYHASVYSYFTNEGLYGKYNAYKDNIKTRVRDNILKSKEQKNIQPTKGGHKMVTCQNYVSLFYRQITSCPSDGGIS